MDRKRKVALLNFQKQMHSSKKRQIKEMEEIDEMYDSMVENDTDIDDDDGDGAIIAYAYAVAAANNRCGPRGKPVFERCLQLFLNV